MIKVDNIPSNWKIEKLENLAEIKRGKFSHRPRNEPRFYGGEIPFIQTGDVTNSNGYITKFSQTLNEEGLKISKMFPKGTICITIAANIGDVGLLTFESAFPDSIIGIIPNRRLIDTTYLLYFMMRFKQFLDNTAVKSTQKNINLGYIKPLEVLLPPFNEQQKISSILSNVDDIIQTTQLLIDQLQILKRGLMKKLFTEGLGHSEFQETKLGKIPNSWKIFSLDDVIDIYDAKRVPLSSEQRKNRQGTYPYCGATGIVDYIDDFLFDGEYVLLAEDGGKFEQYSSSAYLMTGKFWVNNHAHVICGKSQILNNHFLLYFLNKINLLDFIVGSTRQKLNQSALKKIKISIPPFEEQQKISNIFKNVDEKINLENNYIEKMKEIKKGLMQQLLTGKIRV